METNGPSYDPYPTIAWDFINRAMPVPNPGSLKPDEVYRWLSDYSCKNSTAPGVGQGRME